MLVSELVPRLVAAVRGRARSEQHLKSRPNKLSLALPGARGFGVETGELRFGQVESLLPH